MIVDVKDRDCEYWNWKVYLDGKELNKCVRADSEEGIAIVVVGFSHDSHELNFKTLEGEVRIEWIGD